MRVAGNGNLVAPASASDLRGRGADERGENEAMPQGGGGAGPIGAACCSLASIEVVALLAVRDGGLGSALACDCGRSTPFRGGTRPCAPISLSRLLDVSASERLGVSVSRCQSFVHRCRGVPFPERYHSPNKHYKVFCTVKYSVL